MNRTSGDVVQVTSEAGEAAAQAMQQTAARTGDAVVQLDKALQPLEQTWGTSSGGQQCFTAKRALRQDTENLISLVNQTAKTIRDNTLMGIATDKSIAANFS